MTIKKDTWKIIIKVALSILTAIGASMGITSCIG